MSKDLATTVIERQQWIEPAAEKTQSAIGDVFESAGHAGQSLRNFLHGTWLGHPIHPAITDVPVGSWTAAVVLDAFEEITGRSEFGRAADAGIAIGLAGAVASALTGIVDWQATDGRARKIGFAHGLLNTVGALLFTGSLIARRRNDRSVGRALSTLGYTVALGSAYLGGKLVFSEGIGTDHTIGQQFPEEFRPVMKDSELGEGDMRRVDVDGSRVLVAKRDGRVYAIAEVCSHLGGPLAEGKFEGCTVECPWHGSRFSIEDGSVMDGPATHPQPALEVRVRDGQIEVRTAS